MLVAPVQFIIVSTQENEFHKAYTLILEKLYFTGNE
jgi:hypothetical protein